VAQTEITMSARRNAIALSRRRVLSAATLALALPWAIPALAKDVTLRGTVSFSESITVPPDAVLEVSLVDLTPAEAPESVVTIGRMRTRGLSSIAYRLTVDDRLLHRGHNYVLKARILVDGKVWLANTTPHPVMRAPVQPDMPLERVAAQAPEAPSPKGKWLAESIRTAGVIDNLQSTLEIASDGTVNGRGGCNGFGGKATIAGDKISFGALVATQMACAPAILDQEGKFLSALHDARRWMIDDERHKLILFDDGNREILLLARM
jgi:putative lipoprotein